MNGSQKAIDREVGGQCNLLGLSNTEGKKWFIALRCVLTLTILPFKMM